MWLTRGRPSARDQVLNISGNVHSSYRNRPLAEQAWILANAVGTVSRLTKDGRATSIPTVHLSDDVMASLLALPDEYMGREWYVVTKGRRPGVYPSW